VFFVVNFFSPSLGESEVSKRTEAGGAEVEVLDINADAVVDRIIKSLSVHSEGAYLLVSKLDEIAFITAIGEDTDGERQPSVHEVVDHDTVFAVGVVVDLGDVSGHKTLLASGRHLPGANVFICGEVGTIGAFPAIPAKAASIDAILPCSANNLCTGVAPTGVEDKGEGEEEDVEKLFWHRVKIVIAGMLECWIARRLECWNVRLLAALTEAFLGLQSFSGEVSDVGIGL
jgi:hypothetical protein